MTDIKNIEDLIGDDKKLVESKITRLTAAGDNYGSLMLAVDITVKDHGGRNEIIRAVAKMLPKNEFVQKVFNCQYTFRNEVGFYQTIAPRLGDFQKEHGLTELYGCLPAFLGARLSLDPKSSKVDEDAVLLIKNIKDEGFHNIDRTVGFDLDQAKLILRKMAELHGSFMAFKAQKADVFEKELSQFFRPFNIFDFGSDSDTFIGVKESLIDIVKDDEFCASHLDKMTAIFEEVGRQKLSNMKNKQEPEDDPYLSLVHSDLWTNNIMIKTVNDKTVDVKFVDYQLYEYSSLARDVIFFLFTSVQTPIIKKHCDDLLKFYYEHLIHWLKSLKHDTSAFSFEGFIESMKKRITQVVLFHIMIMLGPIYAEPTHITDVEEMSENALVQQRSGVSKQCKEKGCFVVREFVTRGWL